MQKGVLLLLPITGHDVHSVELIYVKVVSERKKKKIIIFSLFVSLVVSVERVHVLLIAPKEIGYLLLKLMSDINAPFLFF